VAKEPRLAPGRRVDAGGVTLAWGDPTEWKAALRDESQQRHRAKPIGERLRAALALVVPRARP
jgi:hypothetical protein